MDSDERRRHALQAATHVANDLGLTSTDPVVLRDSNNTVVWLWPLPLVAKVGTSPLSGPTRGLAVELDVLAHLGTTVAPVTRLAPGLPPKLHEADGLSVLLLDYVEHDADRPVPPALVRDVLVSVHRAMLSYQGDLPAFTDQLNLVGALLADPSATPALSPDDRVGLTRIAHHFGTTLRRDETWRPLHGDPWIGGNLLWTPTGAVLLDFEAASVGPVEWDWSSVPIEAIDPDLRLNEVLLADSAFSAASPSPHGAWPNQVEHPRSMKPPRTTWASSDGRSTRRPSS